MKHFGIPEDGILCCDVLAGEQGPSCFSVKQTPDFKVIHVRFIERLDGEGELETKHSRPVARSSPVRAPPPRRATAGMEIVSTSHPCGIRPEKVSPESRFIPKSLSVVDMLKLGNQIKRTTTAIGITILTFKLWLGQRPQFSSTLTWKRQLLEWADSEKLSRPQANTKSTCTLPGL